MRRIVIVVALVLTALFVELALAQMGHDVSEQAAQGSEEFPTYYMGAPEEAMFCTSSLRINNAEGTDYWSGTVFHPKGGRELVDQSIRLLPQKELPDPLPLPLEELLAHYQIEATVCYGWYEIFDLTNALLLNRALSRLEDPYAPITRFDARRALMKSYFNDKWQIAEEMYPLSSE